MFELNIIHKDWEAKTVFIRGDFLVFEVESVKETANCPECGKPAYEVHSRYTRTLNDLSILNYKVQLKVRVRKFFCRNAGCIRRIFAEQLIGLADKYSRKTFRLTEALLKLSMITSAEAASKIAATIAYGTSPNTLLRLIKDYEVNSYVDMEKVQHIGIDDWAFKKKKTYGTLICDLVTQRPIDILPDRDANTLSNGLRNILI